MAADGDIGWIPLYGEFDIQAESIRFKGKRVPIPTTGEVPPGAPEDQPAFGLLLSSQTLADGDISAEVEFEALSDESICELAVAYDANARQIVTAGLGSARWALFGVREFGGPRTGGQGWWDYRTAGDRANLRAGVTYRIEARFRGAMVMLSVDGVAVAHVEVSSPFGKARQVGLLCRGEHPISIRNYRVNANKPKAFVVMQFSGEYEAMYRDVISEVCRDYEVSVIRADEVSGPGLVISDIVREITESQLVIADITPINANVYFEVGYAMALVKPTILLAKKDTQLPFDVAGFRVLFYEDTIGGKSKLEDGLRRHLTAILAE